MQTDDIYKNMATDAADRYDFSEYPLDHPLYDISNRKALGFFKDELNSVPMREFVGLDRNAMLFIALVKLIRICLGILDLWRRRQQKVLSVK